MSATFGATPSDLRALATFLDAITEASRQSGVWLCGYNRADVTLPNGDTLHINLQGASDDDEREYVIDDRIGD